MGCYTQDMHMQTCTYICERRLRVPFVLPSLRTCSAKKGFQWLILKAGDQWIFCMYGALRYTALLICPLLILVLWSQKQCIVHRAQWCSSDTVNPNPSRSPWMPILPLVNNFLSLPQVTSVDTGTYCPEPPTVFQ